MFACDTSEAWTQFLEYVKKGCSQTAYENWLAPIRILDANEENVVLEVPNVFVKEYLLANYKKDLCAFLPVDSHGDPAIEFVIAKKERPAPRPVREVNNQAEQEKPASTSVKLNKNYRFETFIEGPTNRFVKSAAMGVAVHPGRSYNPLFIWGGVGLGKTHILHSIGHYVCEHHSSQRVQCITTEAFINDLVDHLRAKSIDRMKRFYRSSIDLLLVDDIQFLQNRLNFEEELCHTFEALMNQGKQIVITSDKPPSQLKLSERLIGRMEWGLVVNIGVPELETRVAILQHKAEQKGLQIPHDVAFYIAEQIQNNIRQLEGAVNRLSAQCRLMNMQINEVLVEKILRELLQETPQQNISIDVILRSVAAIFDVRVSDIRGASRTKEIALARQVAMYLAKRLMSEPCIFLATSFGKTHSTLLHACQNIEKKRQKDKGLQRRIELVLQHIKKSH